MIAIAAGKPSAAPPRSLRCGDHGWPGQAGPWRRNK